MSCVQIFQDIGINGEAFGTHSFRRGGCQFYATYHNWNLINIALWGGWSLSLNLRVIIQYLQADQDPLGEKDLFIIAKGHDESS